MIKLFLLIVCGLLFVDASAQVLVNMDRSKRLGGSVGGGGELQTPVLAATDSTGNKVRIDLSNLNGASTVTMYYRTKDRLYERNWAYVWTDTTFAVSGDTYTYYFTNLPNGWELRFFATASDGESTSSASNIVYGKSLRSPGVGFTRYFSTSGSATWAACTTSTNPAAITTLLSNWSNIGDGDSILFNRGETWAPASGGGSTALLEPNSNLTGTYLNPIVFAAYGTGTIPVISNANQTSKHALYTIASRLQYVYFQDIQFRGALYVWAYSGENKGCKYLRLKITNAARGIDMFMNPTSFTKSPSWKWTSEGNGTNDSHEVAYCEISSISYDGIFYSTISDSVKGYAWIHHNDIFDVGEDGIDLQGSFNLCEYNIIVDFGQTGVKNMPHYNGGLHNEFRGNIVIPTGVNTGGGFTFPSNDSSRVYNNTFGLEDAFASGSLGWEALAPPVNRIPKHNIFANNIWHNDIYVHNLTGTMVYSHSGDTTHFTSPDSVWTLSYFWNNNFGSLIMQGRRWGNSTGTYSGSGTINYNYTGEPGFSTYLSGVTNLNAKTNADGNVNATPGWNATPTLSGLVRDSIIKYYSPSESSNLLNGGVNMSSYAYTPFTEDIAGNPIPQSGAITIGAVQQVWQGCSATNHFTTAGIPFANNDFLVQSGGIKNITITGHTALQGVDSVRLALYKNGILFLSDTEMLSYDGCDSSNFSVSINIPADTATYTLRLYKDAAVIDSASGLRVGNAYLVMGQSNAKQDVSGYNTQIASAITESIWFESYVTFKNRINATSGTWDWEDIGTTWAILGDSVINKLGYPVMIINAAVGGTTISQHLPGQSIYEEMVDRVEAIRQHINGWTKMFWWQAESDTDLGAYPASFGTLRTGLMTDAGVDTITLVQLALNACIGMGTGTYEMQRQLGETYDDVKVIGMAGFTGFNGDNCHQPFATYSEIGTWLFRKSQYTGYDNPVVDSITYVANSGIVNVYFDQPITYIDTLAIDHDDYWLIDGAATVDTGYVVSSNIIRLELDSSPDSVDDVGYVRDHNQRYPLIRNANRVSAILFDNYPVNASSSTPVMTAPTFMATFGSNSSLRLQGTFDSDTDTVRINQKRVSYPVNAYSDSVLIVRLSSGSLDTTITGSWYNDTTYYFRCSTIGDSSGTSVTTYALDTSKVPAAGGGGGGGDIFNITFESNSITGSDAFTSVTATTNTFTVVSDTVSVGTYAAKIDPTGSSSAVVYGVKTFTTSGSVYVKGKIWIGHPATADYAGSPLMFIDDGGGTSMAEVTIRQASFGDGGYDFTFFGQTVNGSAELGDVGLSIGSTFGQWVDFELNWIKHASTGGMVFKLNGVTVYSELDGNTSSYTASRFVIGFGNMYNINGDNLPNANHYFDDIKANSTAFP